MLRGEIFLFQKSGRKTGCVADRFRAFPSPSWIVIQETVVKPPGDSASKLRRKFKPVKFRGAGNYCRVSTWLEFCPSSGCFAVCVISDPAHCGAAVSCYQQIHFSSWRRKSAYLLEECSIRVSLAQPADTQSSSKLRGQIRPGDC